MSPNVNTQSCRNGALNYEKDTFYPTRIAFIVMFVFRALVSVATGLHCLRPRFLADSPSISCMTSQTRPQRSAAAGETAASAPVEAAVVPLTAQLEMKPGEGIMLDTGSKIVNLLDPTGRKYLRVGIVLEFAPNDLKYFTMTEEEKTLFLEEFNKELNVKLPVINDVIITLLSNQTFEAVYTAEGKETLRKQIMDTINSKLPENKIIFVYFTEFVVQ